MTLLYLDHNATTPLHPDAEQAMVEAMRVIGNGSSVHQFGRQVRSLIEQGRQSVADYFQTKAENIIFTSGATEANHLALCGFEGCVIVSAVEHDSVDQARLDRLVCPVDAQGVIDLKALASLLQTITEPVMISVAAANNETGIVQPMEDLIALAKSHNAFIHSDAVQAVGRLPFLTDGIDLISVSAHKIGGPQGVGALVKRSNVPLKAQLRGGGQERSLRSGTENALGIVGFGAALRKAQEQDWTSIATLRDELENRLIARCPEAVVLANKGYRLPNTTVLAMPGVKSTTQVMSFDLKGIAVSAGSACSSGKIKPSRILAAMGISKELADCSIRISLGIDSHPDLINRFIDAWATVYKEASRKGTQP
jgi:cysteine desulfurase